MNYRFDDVESFYVPRIYKYTIQISYLYIYKYIYFVHDIFAVYIDCILLSAV